MDINALLSYPVAVLVHTAFSYMVTNIFRWHYSVNNFPLRYQYVEWFSMVLIGFIISLINNIVLYLLFNGKVMFILLQIILLAAMYPYIKCVRSPHKVAFLQGISPDKAYLRVSIFQMIAMLSINYYLFLLENHLLRLR